MAFLRRIVTTFDARTAEFDRGTRRMNRNLSRFARQTEGRLARLDRRMARFGTDFGRGLILRAGAAAAAIVAVRKALGDLVRAGDTMRKLTGRFKALGKTAEETENFVRSAFGIATDLGSPLEGTIRTVTRFSIAAEAINATDQEVVQLTENVLKLGVIGGSTTQELIAGSQQLSQSLAKGRLDGDELRSVLENMPLVARQIAKEFGVATGRLKDLGEKGLLTTQRVFDALLSSSEDLDDQFRQLPVTVERAANSMTASWVSFLAVFNETTGINDAIIDMLEGWEAILQNLEIRINPDPLGELGRELLAARNDLAALETELQDAGVTAEFASTSFIDFLAGKDASDLGAELVEELSAKVREATALVNELELSMLNLRATPFFDEDPGEIIDRQIDNSSPVPKPRSATLGVIDLRNEDPFTRARRGRKPTVNTEAVAILEQLRERIDLLRLEQELIGKTASQQARLNAEFQREKTIRELRDAAAEKGATITAEEIAQAEALADKTRDLTLAIHAETEALAAKEEAAERAAQAVKQIGDAISNAILQADSFTDALKNVAVALANIALQELSKQQSGGGGGLGSILGSLVGSLFGGGGAPTSSPIPIPRPVLHRGGVVGQPGPMRAVPDSVFAGAPRYHGGGVAGLRSGEVPAILQAGEVVIPKGIGRGSGNNVTVQGSTIVLQGSDATPEELQRVLDRRDRQLVERIVRMNENDPTVFHT